MSKSIKDTLLKAPDSQLDVSMRPLIKKWDDEPTALQILQVLDMCIFGSLASGFTVQLLQTMYDEAIRREGTTREAVEKLATWREEIIPGSTTEPEPQPAKEVIPFEELNTLLANPRYKYLCEHLKLWEDSGKPAPVNEIQSIQAWHSFLLDHTKEETLKVMMNRMILLGYVASDLHDLGPNAENIVGIYDKRPDMRP